MKAANTAGWRYMIEVPCHLGPIGGQSHRRKAQTGSADWVHLTLATPDCAAVWRYALFVSSFCWVLNTDP